MARPLVWLAVASMLVHACSVGSALGKVLGPAQQEIKDQQDFYEEYEQQTNKQVSSDSARGKKHKKKLSNQNDSERSGIIGDNGESEDRGDGAGDGGGNVARDGARGGEDSLKKTSGTSQPRWMSSTRCTLGDNNENAETTTVATTTGASGANGTNAAATPSAASSPDATPAIATAPATAKHTYLPPRQPVPAHLYIDDD